MVHRDPPKVDPSTSSPAHLFAIRRRRKIKIALGRRLWTHLNTHMCPSFFLGVLACYKFYARQFVLSVFGRQFASCARQFVSCVNIIIIITFIIIINYYYCHCYHYDYHYYYYYYNSCCYYCYYYYYCYIIYITDYCHDFFFFLLLQISRQRSSPEAHPVQLQHLIPLHTT